MKNPKTVNLIARLVVACLLLTCLFITSTSKAGDDKNYNVKLQIINDKNTKNFLVKVVRKNEDREQGLMWITNLPESYGMVFEFEKEQVIHMWMKNTKIPLDMIFIDQNNKIIKVVHNTKPESLEVISSEKPITKVLEINGGLAKKLGILVGDRVVY